MSFFTQFLQSWSIYSWLGLSMDLSLVSNVYYHAKHTPKVLWKYAKSPLGFF
jgi:hypothetical protein